jgi:hypothetical protein
MIPKSPFEKDSLSLVLERVNSQLQDGNDQEGIKADLANNFRPNEISQLFEHLQQLHLLNKYKWWEILNLLFLAILFISFSIAGYIWLNFSTVPEAIFIYQELNPNWNFVLSIAWIISIVIHFIGTIRNHSQSQLFSSIIYILTVLSVSKAPIEAFNNGIYWVSYSLISITFILTSITIFKCKPYLRSYFQVVQRSNLNLIKRNYMNP